MIAPYFAGFFDHTSTRVGALFVSSLLISMGIIKIISLLPFGSYIVGQVKKTKPIQKNMSKDEPFSPPLQAVK